MPYRDYFDHKGPLLYFFLAVWQAFFGSSLRSAQFSLIPIYVLFGLSLYALATVTIRDRRSSLAAAVIGIWLVLRPSVDFPLNGSILVASTGFACLALTTLYQSTTEHTLSQRERHSLAFASGLLACLAIATRQSSITPLLSLFAGPLLFRSQKCRLRQRIFGSFAAGFSLTAVLSVGYFYLTRTPFHSIVDALIGSNIDYVTTLALWSNVTALVRALIPNLMWWIIILLGGGWYSESQHSLQRYAWTFLQFCLVSAFCLRILTLNPIAFYEIQYIPYLVTASVLSLPLIWSSKRMDFLYKVRIVLLAAVVVTTVLFYGAADISVLVQWYQQARAYNFEISAYPDLIVAQKLQELMPQTNSSDPTLFVYGNRAWLYVLSGFESPSRYYYVSPATDTMQLTESLIGEPPQVFVVWPSANQYGGSNLPERLSNFIRQHYVRAADINIESAWPYTITGPVSLYVLAEDHP